MRHLGVIEAQEGCAMNEPEAATRDAIERTAERIISELQQFVASLPPNVSREQALADLASVLFVRDQERTRLSRGLLVTFMSRRFEEIKAEQEAKA